MAFSGVTELGGTEYRLSANHPLTIPPLVNSLVAPSPGIPAYAPARTESAIITGRKSFIVVHLMLLIKGIVCQVLLMLLVPVFVIYGTRI